jgi:putative tryptophan/tyrosine transport system substrate-binding protein
VKRRTFLTLISGAAACPLTARAQSSNRITRIGFIMPTPPTTAPAVVAAFRDGLRDRGYVEGQNLQIEFRWPAVSFEQSRAIATDLLHDNVDIIVAWGAQSVVPARRATTAIPIVMVGVSDPVGLGFVSSLARPGGNITGVSNIARDLSAKLVELLAGIVPGLRRIGVVRNPNAPGVALQLRETQAAAQKMGLEPVVVEAREPAEFQDAFSRLSREGAKAVVLLADPSLIGQATMIAELALAARMPTAFQRRESVDAGGLLSYGPNFADQLRLAASYVDRIMKGAKPADLPIEQPTRIELIINLKTAKALGLTVPPNLLATADEVIE